MIEVDQIPPLLTKTLLDLTYNPACPIAHTMNLTLLATSGSSGTLEQLRSRYVDLL
jgi:hypothetical protein